jgi:WXG100 family type VII secretion target
VTSMFGADLGQLRQLASKFDKDGDTLNSLIASLNGDTNGSNEIWKGPAADRFRGEWNDLKPTFDKFVQTLHEAAKAIRTNADNIESATR